MKKVWKKMIPLLAAMSLAFAAGGITAGAVELQAETESGGSEYIVKNTATVTIEGDSVLRDSDVSINDVSFTTYQVLYATYDEESNAFEWHLTEWAKTALNVGGFGNPSYATEQDAIKAISEINTTGQDASEQTLIVNTLVSYVANNSTAVTQYSSASWTPSDTSVKANLPVGAYLVLPSCSSMSFMNMLVSVDVDGTTNTAADGWTVTANGAVLKGKPIGITKQIKDNGTDDTYGKDASAGIGDTVYYALTVDVPQFPDNCTAYKFTVTDQPSNVSIDKDSVKVYKGTSVDAANQLVENTNYTVSVDSKTGLLTVDFSGQYLTTFYNSASSSFTASSVYITYSATVQSSADISDATSGAATANTNKAKVNYASSYTVSTASNISGTNEDEDDADLYTYGAVITKYGEDTDTPLSNTTFQVSYGGSAIGFVTDNLSTDDHKVYRVANSGATGLTTALVTGKDGTVTVIGLDASKEYTVAETKAPSGYSLNTDYMKFTIVADTVNGSPNGLVANTTVGTEYNSAQQTVSSGSWTFSNTYNPAAPATPVQTSYVYLSVSDTEIAALPATGSIGIIVFTIAGVAIMILALVLINSGKSKQKKA